MKEKREKKEENPHSTGSDRWKEILQRKGLTKLHIYIHKTQFSMTIITSEKPHYHFHSKILFLNTYIHEKTTLFNAQSNFFS
jgi:hypothetical protein